MRGTLCAWALLVQLLAAPAHCGVTGYMGNPTTDQSPQKPTAYVNAVAPLVMTRINFDDMPYHQQLVGQSLDGMQFASDSPDGLLVTDDIYGFGPASSPFGLIQATAGVFPLAMLFDEPVCSVGFVLHHQSVSGRLSAWDGDDQLLGQFDLPFDLGSPANRWVGLVADADVISRLEYEPLEFESFGVDDLEYGRTPLPASLLLLAVGLVAIRPSRRGAVA